MKQRSLVNYLSIILILVFLPAVAGLPQTGSAQVYRYKDKQGVYHFTDTPTDTKFTRPPQEPGQVGFQISYHPSNPDMESAPNKLEYTMKAVISLKSKRAIGSGFIISPLGFAVTNYHVIGNAEDIKAITHDQRTINVHVLHTDQDKDLALLKLEGEGYPFLPLANTSEPQTGQDVFTIGAPLGFSHTFSKGIVSAIRKVSLRNSPVTLIQTDARINRGNSGGPLVTFDGKVIGVITLKVMQAEGIGFAVSTEDIVQGLNLLPAKE